MLNYRIVLMSLVAACLGLAGVFAGHWDAAAQEPEQFVDVGVVVNSNDDTTSRRLRANLWVFNRGNQPAYDVAVEFTIGASQLTNNRLPDIGTFSHRPLEIVGADAFEWHIPKMPAHSEYLIQFSFEGEHNLLKLEYFSATITSSSYEGPDRLQNNEAEAWAIRGYIGGGPAEPDYSVRVAAVNTSASSADFTVTAVRPFRDDGSSIFKDGCVNIQLTSGLTAGTPAFTKVVTEGTAPVAATGRSFDTSADRECGGSGDATGVFRLPEYHGDIASIMTLPVTVNSGSTLSEQCLTAGIFATPPNGVGRFYDYPADNEAKVCLGAPPDETIVFSRGESDLFTWYDCSEITGYPCNTSVSLELVALGGTAAAAAGATYSILEPDDIVVHIPDTGRRATSSASTSAAIAWSTGWKARPGVILAENSLLMDAETTIDNDQWGAPVSAKIEVSGPGEVSAWYEDTHGDPQEWFGAGANKIVYDGDAYLDYREAIWHEYGTLGTYQVTQTIKATYDNDTTDTTAGVEYTGSGTYTVHVGPMVELEVRDGGASPNVADDQYAITVYALNNGPDEAVDAEVTIDLTSLPAGVTVEEHMVSHGDGTYSAGTWDLGALKTAEHRRGVGRPAAATLTFILAGDDASSATATASIANVTNYTVCISNDGSDLPHTSQTNCEGDSATTNVWYATVCVKDSDGTVNTAATHDTQAECEAQTDAHTWAENICASSDGNVRAGRTETECGGWFQGTVYEHKDSNNTATITAAAGTGGGGDGAPGQAADPVSTSSASITVTWEPVTTVNGTAVTHYQLERSASPWEMIADNVKGTTYIDTTVRPGRTYQYRVRAVNGSGHSGTWSAPMRASAPAPRVDRYARFATSETTRPLLENSLPGSPVGAPVAAVTNSGNRATYSLEGEDAHLFDIESDSGQILVGEDLVLDGEAVSASYTVVVVADPRSGSGDRITVTIYVVMVSEAATVTISPTGPPEVGQPLTAVLTHSGGEPGNIQWQWQRAVPDGVTAVASTTEGVGLRYNVGVWYNIEGANSSSYTPTEQDAGYRLQAIVTYRPPGEEEGLALAGAVTVPLPGVPTLPEPPPAPPEPSPQPPVPGSGSDDREDRYAFFATQKTTRTVAGNSPAGAPVGNPVVATTNRGNRVIYSLEGEDARLFYIEPDSGQILVGEDLILGHDNGPDRYTVVVVADPRSGQGDRITVTINVLEVVGPSATGRLTLSPKGMPVVGRKLSAAVAHPDGEVTVVSWQWQRSADGLAWKVIAGADGASYTPSEADAGHLLRVVVLYRPPRDEEPLVLTGLVTEPLPGPAVSPAESADPPATVAEPDSTNDTAPEAEKPATLQLLPLEGVMVGELAVALLSHPHGRPGNLSWQWQRSVDGADWRVIEGANDDHYVPTSADAGRLLRVIASYQAMDGGMELVGAATKRLPGTLVTQSAPEPTPEPKPEAAQAVRARAEPTPLPVAVATPVPTSVPMQAPAPGPTAAPEPTATATPLPLLVTASSLASRGVGPIGSTESHPPSAADAGVTSITQGQPPEAAAAPNGQNGLPLEGEAVVDPTPPDSGAELAVEQGRPGIIVWMVMGVFALLVLGGGYGYYSLRIRRR